MKLRFLFAYTPGVRIGEAHSAEALRREILTRNHDRAQSFAHETTFGSVPCVIYAQGAQRSTHGNFLDASYRRILADESWRHRLGKVYTAEARVARRHDRRRGELECATSSDALLMNVFCFPGVTLRAELCALLGHEAGARPEFGVRARVPMRRGLTDRTEMDMRLGDMFVEAKLTEGGFQTARPSLVERYCGLDEVFAVEDLPRRGELFAEYQLVRGVLAAHASGGRFLLICDGRRGDLRECWFKVMRAVRLYELRGRLQQVTWQEIAAALSPAVRSFLAAKYGIEAS